MAIARQRGMETIDAEVTTLRSRWRLPAEADIVQIIHAEQERMFMEQSGLAGVQIHGYHLMLEAGRALPREEVAHDWYARVYRPAVEAIRRERLDAVTSGVTEADMFLCV